MPYLAKLEKAGIPTVVIDYADQENMVKEESTVNGVPLIRFVHASRTLPGPVDMDRIIDEVIAGLTRPLTEEEKRGGRLDAKQPRILFEGTLPEAEKFYQQTRHIPKPVNAPICVYTDGFPIVIPTEDRVKEMLTGTSHRPDELITLQSDRRGERMEMQGEVLSTGERRKGDLVRFLPLRRTATVEQVAVNAVMAGCRPEHLPVVLAIAESGVSTGTTVFNAQWVCVSGPIVKEIGMNTGCGMMGPGNIANSTIGRAYQLMALNLGGAVPGVNRMNSIGSPLTNGGTCFAEDTDSLPPGWDGLNEESGFEKAQSCIMIGVGGGIAGGQFSPGGYRAFQKSGHGALARNLDVKGVPGPHNWLTYLTRSLWAGTENGKTFVMVAEMARHLYECGFKSKVDVYEWLWKQSFEPVKNYKLRSWPDIRTNGWMGIERTSGKHWKELPDDYMVPAGWDDAAGNCIIVCSSEEEVCVQLSARGGVFGIDAWR